MRVSERVEQLVVTVASPDGNVIGELAYGGRARFGFRSDSAYQSYDSVRTVAAQFTSVLNELYERRRGAKRRIATEAGQEVARSDEPHWDARRRRYRAQLADVSAAGTSRGALVAVAAVGMRRYSVAIQPRALELPVGEFVDEFEYAYFSCWNDHRMKVAELRRGLSSG